MRPALAWLMLCAALAGVLYVASLMIWPPQHPLLIDAAGRSGGAGQSVDAKLDAQARDCPLPRRPTPPEPGRPQPLQVLPSDAWRIV